MMNQKLLNFYENFRNSKAYNIVAFLIILMGLLYYPLSWPEGNPFAILTGRYFNLFIIGPYILLTLMFGICFLYKHVLLYLFILLLLIPNFLLLYVAVAMGSGTSTWLDIGLFVAPIIVFLIINIITATLTYKYKVKTYNKANN